jgi:3-hydroxyacyl-CoA dehydrogenase
LLKKDVSKGRMSETDAKDARSRVEIISTGMDGFSECDMVVEVRRIYTCAKCAESHVRPRRRISR